MTSLESRLRSHIDTVAPPIPPSEILEPSPTDSRGQARSRWMLTAAACALLIAGIAATVVVVIDRSDSGPVAEPGTAAPAAPPRVTPSVPTTILAIASTEFVVEAGLTLDEVADALAATLDTIDATTFSEAIESAATGLDFVPDGTGSAEGLIAPGRYEITEDDSEQDIAKAMVERMNELVARVDIVDKGAALGRSPYEILTLASIIEKEARLPEDRDRISRVIHNRLFVTEQRAGGFFADDLESFPLQVDSAVLYGRDQEGLDPDLPFSRIRTIPTDWNTYILPGLPLTPITTPSQESVDAALNPAPNPIPTDPICIDLPEPDDCFLFFYALTGDDGSMAFAATGEQHEANVERARDSGLL